MKVELLHWIRFIFIQDRKEQRTERADGLKVQAMFRTSETEDLMGLWRA